MKKFFLFFLIILGLFCFCACGNKTVFSAEELTAVNEICDKKLALKDLTDVTKDALAEKRAEKFPAIKKVAQLTDGNYAFISAPCGYRGEVTMAVVLDSTNKRSLGVRIISCSEGFEYVRNWTENWFVSRFEQKDLETPLELIKLNAEKDNQIVAVTGATVSTEAAILGVNAAMNLFCEFVLGLSKDAVPLIADGSPYILEGK